MGTLWPWGSAKAVHASHQTSSIVSGPTTPLMWPDPSALGRPYTAIAKITYTPQQITPGHQRRPDWLPVRQEFETCSTGWSPIAASLIAAPEVCATDRNPWPATTLGVAWRRKCRSQSERGQGNEPLSGHGTHPSALPLRVIRLGWTGTIWTSVQPAHEPALHLSVLHT